MSSTPIWDNVVDMLPKPYTEDLLRTTVANAIETAAMIVESQSKGSAVPEIIGETTDPDLAGRFAVFGLREIVDFLNNGNKQGVLEVEAERLRLWIYLDKGRVQGVTATGLSPEETQRVIDLLPESLKSLSEVLRLTIAGRGSTEFEGFVQLMDKRILDPRLTSKLLRFQAAMLLGVALNRELKGYQFRSTANFPSLQKDLPLEVSLLGLLVEHALYRDASELEPDDPSIRYVRRAIRGQNMDRAGLSAKYMKVLNLLSDPRSIDDLESRLSWDREELRRVLAGFVAADLLECQRDESAGKFVAYETNSIAAAQLRNSIKQTESRFAGKVVRDGLTLQLLVKRSNPDAVFFAVDTPQSCDAIREAYSSAQDAFVGCRKIVIAPQKVVEDPSVPWSKLLGFHPDRLLNTPYTHETLIETMEALDEIPVAVQTTASVVTSEDSQGAAIDASAATTTAQPTEGDLVMSQSANASSCKAKLIIEKPRSAVVEKPLENGRSVFLGSGDSCGIQITGEGVAEIHCLIDFDGTTIAVQDWASQSGTIVNGNRIDDRTTLRGGDELMLGTTRVLLQCSEIPASEIAASKAKEPAPEPREESVGMEHLGIEEESVAEPVAEEPVEKSTPAIVQPTGRLSDVFRPVESVATANHGTESSSSAAGFDSAAEIETPSAFEASVDEVAEDDSELEAWTNPQDSGSASDDIEFDPFGLEEEIDPEVVQLLRSEIDDLRIQLAEKDEQIAVMAASSESNEDSMAIDQADSECTLDTEFGGGDLVGRVDQLLAELEEHDERVATLQDLLQSAEMQNEAERDERQCLETWVGEIEQRIGQREAEWQAEQDALRQRIEDVSEERDSLQKKLVAATQRYGDGGGVSNIADETLAKLQAQNAELQSQLEEAQRQLASASKQIKRQQDDEPESVKNALAELAQEKAAVSRMRFQLSKELEDVGEPTEAKDQPDKEFAFKLQTLRQHLREIHEEEKIEREKKQETLFGRISNLWKRVDDEF